VNATTTSADAETVVVACCQLAPTLGDPAANRGLVAGAVANAAALGAHIVVLPELVASGYMFADRAVAAASAETVDEGP
jgi:predicted amidohydrolase